MCELTVRVAVGSDLAYLAANLRQEDLDEIAAGGVGSPEDALLMGHQAGSCYVAVFDGSPEFIFGVTAVGTIWGFGTYEALLHKHLFHRAAKKFVAVFLEDHGYLWNCVYEKNTTHVKWLKSLGFTFTGDFIEQPAGKFLFFEKGVRDV